MQYGRSFEMRISCSLFLFWPWESTTSCVARRFNYCWQFNSHFVKLICTFEGGISHPLW